MTKKIATVSLQGKQYAQVKDRLKKFREDNPRGSIETTPSFMPDGSLMYKAYILKDKKDPNSADATAHSLYKPKVLPNGEIKDEMKVFEKQETIAVGRALSLLGYSSDGEIASSEEMEEFEEHKQHKMLEAQEEAIDSIKATKSLEELRSLWTSMSVSVKNDKVVEAAKDAHKEKLTADSTPSETEVVPENQTQPIKRNNRKKSQ